MAPIPRSPSKRGHVAGLFEAGLSRHQIAKRLGWPRTTVRRTIDRYLNTGSHYTSGRTGRPSLTAHDHCHIIRDINANHREPWAFFAARHNVSILTIRRIAARHGLHKRVARRKPFITAKAKAARLRWAAANVEQDWERVIWTDEASMEIGGFAARRSLVIRQAGEEFSLKNIQPVFRSGRKTIMVWGAIGINRKFELHFFAPGSVTAHRYIEEVLKDRLCRYARQFKGNVSRKCSCIGSH